MNETQSIDLTSIAVALGRIEEKVSHLTGMEERLRNVETTITELRAQQKPRAPWWAVVGGIAGIASVGINGIALFAIFSKLAEVLP